MSWDLSSEEVICNKLESQQTTIFAFSKKIKSLEANNVELERLADNACMDWHFKCEELEEKVKEAFESGQASAIPRMRELEKKLEIAVNFIKSVPGAHEHYGHELKSMCEEALAAIKDE